MSDETAHWQNLAACKGKPTDWWFPTRHPGRGGTGAMYDAARTICRHCPVKAECLDYALAYEADASRDNRSGMFGGLTPPERRAVADRRKLRTVA